MNDNFSLDSLRNPIDATFELTVRCNLKCRMCMFRHCTSENNELISRELTAEEWIKIAEDAADMGTGSLLITGGEPMLRQDFPEIYRGIYKKGFIISLYTNATLVDDKIMDLLRECPPHKIGISIYGASSETYCKVCGNGDAFRKAIEGAKKLVTLPSVVDFRTTIIDDNYEDAYKIDELIKKEFGEKYAVTMTRMVLKAVRGGCAEVDKCRLSPEQNVLLSQKKAIEKLRELVGESFDIKNVRFRYEKKNTDCENSGKETVIISAPSETGKTTHAHFWRDYKNAIILNGDNACCYKENEWNAFSLPWSGTSGECVNRSVEVKALVILKQGAENSATRLEKLDAFSYAFPNVQYPSYDKSKTEKAVDLLEDFLKSIPVFLFECRNEKESADVLEKVLEENL